MTPPGTRVLLLVAVLSGSCKEAGSPAPQAEVRLATDLPDAFVDTALQFAQRNGAPRAARIEGQRAGVSALPGRAGAPLDGGSPAPTPPPAGDVLWDAEPYGAIAAAARGELAPIPATARDVPPLWKDPGGTWVAIGGRAAVLLVANDALGDHSAPLRFTSLAEPWLKGKVAVVAPTGGMSLAHFAALYQAWGAERMEAWLDALKANRVQVLDSDEAVREAVIGGKAIVGILSSDQAAMAAASAANVEVVYPNQKSIGTFVWPTALAVRKTAAKPDAAASLAEKLADKSIEQLLVARLPGYLPLRPDIPVPPGVRSASNLVVISVDPARIVDEIGRRKASLASWAASAPIQSGAAQAASTR